MCDVCFFFFLSNALNKRRASFFLTIVFEHTQYSLKFVRPFASFKNEKTFRRVDGSWLRQKSGLSPPTDGFAVSSVKIKKKFWFRTFFLLLSSPRGWVPFDYEILKKTKRLDTLMNIFYNCISCKYAIYIYIGIYLQK